MVLYRRTKRMSVLWAVSARQEDQETGPDTVLGNDPGSRQNNNSTTATRSVSLSRPNRDEMIARAAVLRQSILKQQVELQRLERDILCCTSSGEDGDETGNQHHTLLQDLQDHPLELIARTLLQARDTFRSSTQVLRRKLQRVQGRVGPDNQLYNGRVEHYVATQTVTGARILGALAKNQTQWKHLLADTPTTATLVPHLPAIYARLDRLEPHVGEILEKVLSQKKQHLQSIEPYLGQILERFTDLEPHFPWILRHIDTLAPYTGLLLKHIDELLLYADSDYDYDSDNLDPATRYELAEQLLPYLDFYVSRLDLVGPHLPLLRPHIPKLLVNNRIAKITPHIDRLFSKGYLSLGTSANLDILLFWFGWTLRFPLLVKAFFALPGSPRLVTFLANRLPRRFARKCSSVSCSIDGDYGAAWNRLSKE